MTDGGSSLQACEDQMQSPAGGLSPGKSEGPEGSFPRGEGLEGGADVPETGKS